VKKLRGKPNWVCGLRGISIFLPKSGENCIYKEMGNDADYQNEVRRGGMNF